MISAANVSTALRKAGYRVRTSAPRNQDAIRVHRDETTGCIKVRADYTKTTYAVLIAEELASALREAGYVIDALDNKTFFYVTGVIADATS